MVAGNLFVYNKEINYFNILGVPISFDVNLQELENCYLKRMRKIHPDRYGGSRNSSAELNQAYKIILNPLSRARYLLNIYGYDSSKSIQDVVILQQSLNDQEKLENIKDLNDLKNLQNSTKIYIENLKKCLSNSFRKNLLDFDKLIYQISSLSYKMKYLSQVEEKIFDGEGLSVDTNF